MNFFRYYDNKGKQSNVKDFKVDGKYQLADKQGSFELLGDRITRLGVNMWVDFLHDMCGMLVTVDILMVKNYCKNAISTETQYKTGSMI